MKNGDYATQVGSSDSQASSNDTTNTNSNSQTLETFISHTFGNNGVSATYQRMIMQYRETINAVDIKILNDLSQLFMGIY